MSKKLTTIGIWLIAFMFPILMVDKLATFINTDSLSIYWLIVPLLISIGVLLKSKIMRWIMLFGIYLSFFYEFIGTNTGMMYCFSNTIMPLQSFANFISMLPHLIFLIITHIFYIFLLSHKESYNYFKLDKSIRIHEIGILGINAFSVMHFNVIYWLFLE